MLFAFNLPADRLAGVLLVSFERAQWRDSLQRAGQRARSSECQHYPQATPPPLSFVLIGHAASFTPY